MCSKGQELFSLVRKEVQKEENYIPRDYDTVGGMWTVDTWKKNGVYFNIMDEGYTERIFVSDILEAVRKYDDSIIFYKGDVDTLGSVLNSLNEESSKERNSMKMVSNKETVIRLPFIIGAKLYDISEFLDGIRYPEILECDSREVSIRKDSTSKELIYCIDSCDYREADFGRVLFNSEEDAINALHKLKKWGRCLD